jgi:catechol 2,3-dioxygenase-like lactoylglutathione lyase family enzyme
MFLDTLRCAPEELPALHDFYTRVIGLTVGDRPEIPAPGYWLYADGQTIVHLYAHLPQGERSAQGSTGPCSGHVSGPLDHISFRAHGLAAMRAHLAAQGVASTENLRLRGLQALVAMAGTADIGRETQDLHMVVVPELNAGSASQNSTAADGTLTVTPARALMWRRPTGLAIIAQAKAIAEARASRSVNAGASDATSDPFPGALAAS